MILVDRRIAEKSLPHRRWRFPVGGIVGNSRFEPWLAKAVWLVIPLQYYVLTRFPNGFSPDAVVAAAAFALFGVVSLFVLSCAIALIFHREGTAYEEQVRMWAIALIVGWAATLALLATSYAVASIIYALGGPELNGDIIDDFLCNRARITYCPGVYPAFDFRTMLDYFIYSSVAVGIIAMVVRRKHDNKEADAPALLEPSVFIVAAAITAVMTLYHGISTLPHSR